MMESEEPPGYKDGHPYYLEKPPKYNSQPDMGRPSSSGSQRQAWGEGKSKPEPEANPAGKAGTPTWREFTQNTTFHGVKYVFDGGSWVRRAFWLLIVLGAIAFFLSMVSMRVVEYYKYTTVISVERSLANEVDFPAVTLCNLNQFRISYADELKLYECLDKTFGARPGEDDDTDCFDAASNMNLTQIVQTLGHQMEQLIDACWWQGQWCNLTSDFKTSYSDIGLCFTFNFNENDQKTVNETGPDGGLKLLLNIEKYEHMRGPNMDSGVKFLLHDPHDLPSMKDSGFVATPGEHTFVSISHTKTETLPFPYGDCIVGGDTITECKRKCYQADFSKVCECRETYMDYNAETPLCSLKDRFTCPCNKRSKDSAGCQSDCSKTCLNPCQTNTYQPTLSSSQLSRINMDTFALIGKGKKERTNATFVNAEEIQLKKSSEWAIIRHAANETLSSYINMTNIMRQFNFTSAKHKYYYLPMFANNFHQDMITNFERKDLKKAQKGKGCGIEEDLEIVMEMAAVFMVAMKSGNKAIQDDPDDCTKAGSEEVKDITSECRTKDSQEKSVREECLQNDEMADKILGETCDAVSEDVEECTCKISNLMGREFNQTLEYVRNLGETYKSDLLSLTGTNDLNATKFQNISDHSSCQARITTLQSIIPELLATLVDITQPLRREEINNLTFIEYVQEAFSAIPYPVPDIFKIEEHLKMTEKGPELLNPCCWPLWYVIDERDDAYRGGQIRHEEEKIYNQGEDKANIDTRILEISIRTIPDETIWKTMAALEPFMKGVSSFIDGTMTTNEMASFLDNLAVERTTNSYITAGEEFIQTLRGILEILVKINQDFDDYVDIMHNQIMTQLLREENLINSRTKMFFSNELDAIKEYITQDCQGETFTSLPDDEEMQMFAKFLCSSLKHIREDLINIPYQLELFDTMFNLLKSRMKTFASNAEMDEDFYMENFLQVDLYYEQLQYEKIEEQPSFVLGSLFSEVGGFLGLLLGASVMTVCELVDYLILLWGKRKREKNAIQT